MEYSYKVNMKRKLKYFLVFALIWGLFFTINLLEILKGSSNKSYDIIMIISLSIVGIFLLFGFLFLKNKIVINENGIFIFSLFSKTPSQTYKWSIIESIEKGYSLGLASLLFKEAIILKSESGISYSIPIDWFEKNDEILDIIRKNNYIKKISIRKEFIDDDLSIIDTFKTSINEFKRDLGTYMLFSGIVLIFALLNDIMKGTGLSIFASIANLYFGIKAMIALNNYAFESINNNKITFNDAWEKTKGKFWRFWGASVVQSLILIVGVFVGIYTYNTKMNLYVKIISILIILGIALITIVLLYMITHISSITTKEKSYFSYNISILKKSYKKIIFITIIENIQLFWLGYIVLSNLGNSLGITFFVNDASIYFSIYDFLILPISSVFIMKILSSTPYFEKNKELKNEEII